MTTFMLRAPWRPGNTLRDPVLTLPVIVATALAVGRLGVDAGVSGARVAIDIALAWGFVVAGLVVLEQTRWRRLLALLTGAALALLAADLRWSSSDRLWTAGLLLAALWSAVVLHLVLTFPDGRPWSRFARTVIVAGYLTAVGGQLVRTLVDASPRDVLSLVASPGAVHGLARAQAALGVAIAGAVVYLVWQRISLLRGAAQRAQTPALVATLSCVPAVVVWLIGGLPTADWSTTSETVARGVALLIPVGLVAGVAWVRLRRPAASDLVVDLKTADPASLRDRLARTLGDPSLEIAYRLDDGRYVDDSGLPLELLRAADRAVTPLIAQGEEVAVLVHDPALLDDPALVESVRAAASLVLENERLAAQVRSQLAEVRRSRARIVAAADAERRRIERNLHDGLQQRLVTLSVTLGFEASRGGPASPDVLSRAQGEVERLIAELRELARGIHPTLLRDEGLEPAIEALARRTPLPVTVTGSVGGRLPAGVELAAYFLVSEALTNVVKHAAASQAEIRLEQEGGVLRVSVEDDGIGGARPAADSGLAGLRDRLDALDASLLVESEPGHGTIIRGEIPCGS
jgi:signal transduction histidine kinase